MQQAGVQRIAKCSTGGGGTVAGRGTQLHSDVMHFDVKHSDVSSTTSAIQQTDSHPEIIGRATAHAPAGRMLSVHISIERYLFVPASICMGHAGTLAKLLSQLSHAAAAARCHLRLPHAVLLEGAHGIQQQRRLEDRQSQCGSQRNLPRRVEVAGLQEGRQGGGGGRQL